MAIKYNLNSFFTVPYSPHLNEVAENYFSQLKFACVFDHEFDCRKDNSDGINGTTKYQFLDKEEIMYQWNEMTKLKYSGLSTFSKSIEIDENAFCETAIEHIYIPSTVNKIGKYAFLNCRKLQIISFKENSELIEIEKNAFSGTIIEAIKIPSNVKKVHKSAFDCYKKLKVIDILEHLGFNPLNNILLPKYRYEIKLCSHEFDHIIQKAGILSFICHYENSLEEVISCLELPKTINIFSSFKSQFSIKLNDFFCFMNKFGIYSLHHSIGMMCAYRVIEQKLTLNDLYLELLDKNNCSKF